MRELEKGAGANWQAALVVVSESADGVVLLNISRLQGSAQETLERLKEASDAPILMLKRNGESGSSDGFGLETDALGVDSAAKLELLQRIQELVERLELPRRERPPSSLTNGKLTVDFENRRVTVEGKPVKLTQTEYNLLVCLARRPGQVMPQSTLLARVWGYERRDDFCTLRTYIRRLRSKIENGRRRPRYIVNQRGRGYKLASFRKRAPRKGV